MYGLHASFKWWSGNLGILEIDNLNVLLLYSSVPPRPTRPPKFDEDAEYEKLKENAALKRRAPGNSL